MDVTQEQATALLELFERQLLAFVRREEFAAMPHIVITGLVEVTGTLMAGGVQLEPAALPALLQQIDHLRARVESAGGRAPVQD